MNKRTVIAIILGFCGAAAICGLTHLNDAVLGQTFLVGNNLPVSVFGGLIVFLFINVGLFHFHEKLALTGKQLAIILAMTLAACCVPGSGLMRTFTASIVLPHHYAKVKAGWQENHIIDESTPRRMLAKIERSEEKGTVRAATAKTLTLKAEASAIEKSEEKGTVRAATAKTLTLSAEASAVDEAYQGMKLRVVDRDGRIQARKIASYTGNTKTATISEEWGELPAPGSVYEILSSNEDAVLTAFMQGRPKAARKALERPLKGVSQGATEKTLILAADSSNFDHAYNGLRVKLSGGKGKGQVRTIVSYHAQSRTVALAEPWKTIPEVETSYELLPVRTKSWWQFWAAEKVRGKAQGGGPDSITLGVVASTADDAFCDMTITISAGAGRGQTRKIIDYHGASRAATVDQPWTTAPVAGDDYEILVTGEGVKAARSGTEGVARAGTESTITLAAAASHRDDAYMGMTVKITAGAAKGQVREILKYDGRRQVLTIYDRKAQHSAGNAPWRPAPGLGSVYVISPKSLVPWYAWARALLFWIPVILALWLSLIGLSVVMHRHWSEHEHLPYPVAMLADSLLPGAGKGISKVLRDRKFWIGAGIVGFIYLNNYFCVWFPSYWVQIPQRFEFGGLVRLVPFLDKAWFIQNPSIFFTVVAFAYFLSTDVSLSVGLAPIVYTFVGGVLGSYGVSLTGGGYFEVNLEKYLIFGAYLGMGGVILYTGRHYYWTVARQAVWLPARDPVPASSVWGARSFIVGILVFIGLLTSVGLSWPLAVLYAFGAVLLFAVMARIIAETGLFFIQCYWLPCGVIIGLFGARALGPETILILVLLSMVLLVDPREALMPFMVNSLKLLELRRQKVGRGAGWCAAALILGVAVAVPMTLYLQYRHGGAEDGWAQAVSQMPFDEMLVHKHKIEGQGLLKESREVSGLGHFARLKPEKPSFLWALLIGLGLVLAFSVGRLRFPKWPLHPVMFLVWAAYPTRLFAFSFLLGCLVKVLVTRFGGSKIYQNLKPLFFGMIAGELLGALLPILVGFVYFLVTGDPAGKDFRVYPG